MYKKYHIFWHFLSLLIWQEVHRKPSVDLKYIFVLAIYRIQVYDGILYPAVVVLVNIVQWNLSKRTLSKPKTCLNQTDFTVPSPKYLCNLNLCKPSTCLNWSNSSVPMGFGYDRSYCTIIIFRLTYYIKFYCCSFHRYHNILSCCLIYCCELVCSDKLVSMEIFSTLRATMVL